MSKSHSKKTYSSKAHTSKAHAQKPERGWLLTIAIILVGISGVLGLIVSLGENGFRTDNLPTWFIAVAAASAIADIVAAFGLWAWKQWGYYLYLGATLASIALGLIATGSLMYAFSHIIPFAIVGYIILPKWKYFD
ncbi:MAG: hypothetical protein ACK2T4_02125 [Candidatus Promineifilaceae bacterium]|jgi:hypothetical protein